MHAALTSASPTEIPGVSNRAGRRLGQHRALKIGYIMSRFPKISETFILYEMLAMEQLGGDVELYPLLQARQEVAHPEVERWARRAHFHPFISLPILHAQWQFFRRDPIKYVKLFWEVLRSTWGSLNFLVGAIGIFPKAVRFAWEMRAQKVDHVHAHFATHPTVAALIIHRLTGIPFSFTAHGSDLHVERRMLGKKIEAAAFAVTISAYNKEIMVKEGSEGCREKIHVVHCGVDPEVFVPQPKPATARPYQILCVASFEEVKGHRYLIEACRLLRCRGVDFECHLVGDGPLRRRVEGQVAQNGLRDRIHVHGAKPRPEVVRMLCEADTVALASVPTQSGKREGIPVVLMEAMASGLPVVSSAISGIPELVESGQSGFLVPPGNAPALADALEELGRDPQLRRQMGQAGRQKVLREFNLRSNAEKLLKLMVASSQR